MAKVKYDREVYYDTTDGNYYQLNPEGTYNRISIDGAGLVQSSPTGAFISQQTLTLSATSQSLTVPATANSALIRIQGGVVTDAAYISLDGSAAEAATDFRLRNLMDTTLPAPVTTEILVKGSLSDVSLLGTAGGSSAIIWYFK